jgi:hypothetical protein
MDSYLDNYNGSPPTALAKCIAIINNISTVHRGVINIFINGYITYA